jgi:threonine dehydrogenase-like Zn-dependent dehydrogenase
VRGVWLEGGQVSVRDDLPTPEARAGETRVRVLRAGVCATDLALRRGYMGFRGVPGHEFVGEALDGPLAGQRVVGEINAGCGECPRCRAGDPRHCETRSVLGILERPGAFAEELALPTTNLLAVPPEVSLEAATFAEPLAAAFEIAEQIELARFERALVAGDGRLGLLCAHVLARAGLDVTVAGRHEARASLLPDGVNLERGLLEDETEDETEADGRRFDLAVEATGNPQALARLVPRMAPRGTLVLKTTTERDPVLPLALVVVNELTLVGSRCGRFEPALEALAGGDVPVERFVEATFPLEEAPAAFERAAAPGTLKVLFDLEG